MKKKSLKINMLLNSVKAIMGILFPLITFPYISRVLGVENVGKYNFSGSIVSYFALVAALGIKQYSVREGAKIRDKGEEFNRFANEMLTINVLSTGVAYILLTVCCLFFSKLYDYKNIIFIYSIIIFFTTIGVEWIYSIYEDFLYITVRSILFQLLSLVLLFIFVKSPDDLYKYVVLTVISSGGSNIMNLLHSKKYCTFKLVKNIDWKTHLKPILIFFAMSISTTVYISSDTTILGIICGDYEVGIYSVSSKIYSMVKTVLSSIFIVSIPRLTNMVGQNRLSEYEKVAEDVYSTLLTFMLPAMVGMILLRKQIINIISGTEYYTAHSSLLLLSIAMFFCYGAYFWSQCVLVIFGEEYCVLKATVISAVINILLNIFLIPVWKENAAALTTIIAELFVYVYCWIKGKKYLKFKIVYRTLAKIAVGCFGVMCVCIGLKYILINEISYVVFSTLCSVIIYCFIEMILKNYCLYEVINKFKEKLIKKRI